MTRGEFAVARFTRLYPIYWVVIAALILAESLHLSSGKAERLDPMVIVRSLFLIASPEAKFPEGFVLHVAWTLVIEVLFYGIFLLFYFWKESAFFWVMALWASAAVIASYAVPHPTDLYWLYHYVLSSRVLEFGLGVTVAYVTMRGVVRFGALALGLGITGLLAAMLDVFPVKGLGPEIVYGIPAACLVYGAAVVPLRITRFLVAIGDASYVLYLTHATVISLAVRIFHKFCVFYRIGQQTGAWLTCGLSIVVAYAVHRAVERPLL